MQSVRFVGVGRAAQIEEVPKPSPGPGQVLIKIGGAGVCHSDLHVMEEDLGFKAPFTLGHENAGWIAALGQGVMGFKEGDAVAVYGPWAAGAATLVSSRWRTTVRSGRKSMASEVVLAWTVGWPTCLSPPRDCWFRWVPESSESRR